MTILRGRAAPVLLATVLFLAGANLGAYAATGKPLLLGRTNVAGASTTIKNTGPGPALELRSRATAPSLRVSSRARVARLNADLLDGVDGAALKNRVHTYSIPALTDVDGFERALPGLPAGRYLASYVVSATTSNASSRLRCSLQSDSGGSRLLAVGAVVSSMANLVGISATGYVEVAGGDVEHLDCFYEPAGTFSTQDDTFLSQVTFVRVDQVVKRASVELP